MEKLMASNNSLAQLLNFTPEDLTTNRAGKLTARQIEYLRRYVRKQEPGCVIVSLFFTAAGGLIIGVLANQVIAGVLGGLLILALFTALIVATLRRSANALSQGDVKIAEGLCSRRIVHSTGKAPSTNYYLKLGDTEFNVERRIYSAFEEGLVYRAYYVLLYADTIVSAETI
jgi:hypothetical protein